MSYIVPFDNEKLLKKKLLTDIAKNGNSSGIGSNLNNNGYKLIISNYKGYLIF